MRRVFLTLLFCLAASLLRAQTPAEMPGAANRGRPRHPRMPAEIVQRRPEPPPALTLPSVRPKVKAYNRIGYALYFFSVAWELLGLGLMIRLGVGARLRNRAERYAKRHLLRCALFYALFSLLLLLWQLPVAYAGYGVERAYGFATHSLAVWLADRGRGYLLGLAMNVPAVWLGSLLLLRAPRRWWLWLWLCTIPWMLATTALYPIWIAPVYNRFVLMEDSPLRQKLHELARKAGIGDAQIYQVDISRRTKKLNAYVAGLGATKRIVLWDTTLKALPEDQILAITGHEIGHYALGHVWWRFVAGIFGAFALLWILSRLLPWSAARFGPRGDSRGLHDLANLPLVLFLLTALWFLQMPVESAISRAQERQADRYGLALTGLHEATARAFLAFVARDYADPDPPAFIVFWFYSHPPIRERVQFALNFPK